MKPAIWINPGVVAIYGSSIDAASHSHHSIQVIWCKEDLDCKLNNKAIAGTTLVNSMVEHQLEMSEGWVLLIEPNSNLGAELSAKLAGELYKSFPISNFTINELSKETEEINDYLEPLFSELGLTQQFLVLNENKVKDKRIQQLLTELNQCLKGDCIKPSSWRASEVAKQLALSESRFLHLFSEEMGISWRPYLLWRRMMCAIQALVNNKSATEAAYLAGFSDSAHLSRTFRKNFGMSIRQALSLF
ncbi:helix-turn-helix transcriptional regulator [Aliikangiella marina]|uniref:Helix-turn-helix transcriptional regulator n=1 Tax=Aliikangiella marina TaxID=1712262 RepID=A0A545TKA0_9GAMM|nr:helix-turn-helix transcriptional regulator [Aliikangiella marina]